MSSLDPGQQVIEIYVLQTDGHLNFGLDTDCRIEVALNQVWE